MEKSFYFEYVQKFFPQLVLSIVEKINERNKTKQTYMYKNLLNPDFSADGKWASILADYSRVAADVVSLDSELPLKKRDSLSTATGDIPKLGMKLYLTEKQMKDIDNMIAQGLSVNLIINKIFADTPRCLEGVWERIEDMFLSGLSTGVALSTRNNGTGIRLSYGYKDENQFGVATLWNGADAKVMDDIKRVMDKADEDSNTITDIWADDTWLNAFYTNQQAREQWAFINKFVGTSVPALDLDSAAETLKKKFGITLHRVNRKIKTEINGVRQSHKPWKDGTAVFTCDEKLGSLVWTTLAENTRPVAGVVYQTADEFILLSKYAKNDPLQEFTSSQAMVVPVIDNVDRIYCLDSKTVQA